MIYYIISGVLFFYSLYTLVLIISAKFYKTPHYPHGNSEASHRLLVFYPAYKPGKELIENLEYMKTQLENFDAEVFVLSQEGDEAINKELKTVAHYVDENKFSHLKGNPYHFALEYAVNRFSEIEEEKGQRFDSVLLMDPDNRMDSQSIRRLIKGRARYSVVLCNRKSGNSSTSTSIFDGISERLNDYMFRRAKSVLKLTPELSGSGMMMDTELFGHAVRELDKKAPGMDKQLLINMMFAQDRLSILYDEEAVVWDEKTENESAFTRQRLRWFGNQYYNAKKFGFKLIRSGRLSLIDYAITLWRPPRSFQFVATVMLIPFDLLAFAGGWISFPVISASALLLTAGLFLFLFSEGKLRKVMRSIIPLAKTSLKNGLTVCKSVMPGIQGTFLHTREN